MKFNLIGSAAHLNISGGNAAPYIKRLDIPALDSIQILIIDTSGPTKETAKCYLAAGISKPDYTVGEL